MVTVPGAIAVTSPVPLIVAIAGLPLPQVPPAMGLVNKAKVPVHIADGPLMGAVDGAVLTITVWVTVAVPQLPVTV
jgi:hypothetical protein